jgi:hypothetical protein
VKISQDKWVQRLSESMQGMKSIVNSLYQSNYIDVQILTLFTNMRYKVIQSRGYIGFFLSGKFPESHRTVDVEYGDPGIDWKDLRIWASITTCNKKACFSSMITPVIGIERA